MRRFKDRREAGRLLGEALSPYANRDDVIVLRLPRGGIVVAAEVAKALRAPLDVCIVRKLGVPGQEELAMGALGAGGLRVLNERILASLGVTPKALEAVTFREQREWERREGLYRAGRAPLDLAGRIALVADDGVATGATLLAALRVLRRLGPSKLVAAVPVGPPSTLAELEAEADSVICLHPIEQLIAIGHWYEDFDQTTDAEVQACLRFVPE